MKNRYTILILLFLLISGSLVYAYLFLPTHFNSLDNRVRDFYFKFRGPQKTSQDIVIVDIDEKSLKALGQWPWQRDQVSQILINLTNANVGIIGLDIVFAEADKTSPHLFAKNWDIKGKDFPNYDEILASTVSQTPTILGYVFDFDKKNNKIAPEIPAIFIEKNKPKDEEFIPVANGIVTNIDIIQNAGYSSGYLNNIPDDMGIIRSVPMMIRYDGMLYPSLAFEMVRLAMGTKKVKLSYAQTGVEDVFVKPLHIKTDRNARLHLNFKGPARSYRYISAVDIYNDDFDKKSLEGKFILIGTSAYGLMDLRSTPMDSVIAGVEIHANMIDNLINNDMLIKPDWAESIDVLAIIFISFVVIFLYSYFGLFWIVIASGLMLGAVLYIPYYLLFQEHIIINIVFLIFSLFFSTLGVLAVKYLFETRQKDMIKGKFASKVSASVMEDILKHPDSDALEGQERELTVFFSDVRGFTNISEAMGDAKTLIKLMNDIMEPMTKIIIDEKGTIDKYIGDAIMAYWNAPMDVDNHADRSVVASLRQLHKLKELNEQIRQISEFNNVVIMADKNHIPIVDIGIGLNSGVAIVGEMGSTVRSDYTVIGDPINLGARLESLCKYYNSRLNISNFTKDMLKGDYIYRFLDLVTVKGKSEPIEIWQIHNFDDEDVEPLFYESREKLLAELESYHKAIELYKVEKFKEALVIFEELNKLEYKSNLKIYDIYIDRCKHYIDMPPKNFNGVFVHTTKG